MKNKSDIEKMMKLASESVDESVVKKKKSNKFKIIVSAVISVFLIIGLVYGAKKLRPQEFVNKTETPPNINENNSSPNNKGPSPDDIWQFERPVKVPEWAIKPYHYSMFENDKVLNEIYEYAQQGQEFDLSVSWMPSGIKGDWEDAGEPFTNKTWEAIIIDENGNEMPNYQYKYALREDYYQAYAVYIQRLINPSFGNWVFAQTTGDKLYDNNTYEVLKDMFTEDWWNNNIKENEDYSKLPILVDWDGDNFGGLELAEYIPGRYGTFYGEINQTEDNLISAEFMGLDERGMEIIKVSTPIKYAAFAKKDKVIEKRGTLELTLLSNEDISRLDNRIVISQAVLIIEESDI
jgi:hypothetical protein